MRLIQTYDEYRKLVKEFKKVHSSTVTNLYMLSNKLNKIISERRFYFLTQNEALIFLSDEQTHYKLYFYQNGTPDVKIPVCDKNVLIELIYNENSDETMLKQIRNTYLSLGAQFLKKSCLYTFSEDIQKAIQQWNIAEENLNKLNISIDSAHQKELDQIKIIWKEYLNELDFEFRTNGELYEMIDSGEIIVARDGNKIVGTVSQSFSDGKIFEQHLAVNNFYQGIGLGKALLAYCLKSFVEKEEGVYQVWIDDDNLKSLNIHKSMGIDTKVGKFLEHYVIYS